MSIIRKIFYKRHFCLDKFDRKYPFNLRQQLNGYLKSFGDKNPDKTFYVIWRDYLGSGFFSNFTQVVSHIQMAKNLGMIPVVDYQNFKTLYNEKEPINCTQNAWEYYFKQLSNYSLEEVYQSKRVFFCNGEPPSNAAFSELPKEYNEVFDNHDMYKKFLNENIELQDAVKNELKKYDHFFNQRILGVHFRGKELNVAQLHAFGPTVEQMFRYTDEILEKYKIEKIFLVTEEKDYFDLFVQRYGNKVLSSDALRVSKVNAYNLKNYRPQHRYLLGMDALVDAILLSKCTGLLWGMSGLSQHSFRSGNHEFSYRIHNGINHKKWYIAKFAFRVKKLLPPKLGGLLDEVTITTRK